MMSSGQAAEGGPRDSFRMLLPAVLECIPPKGMHSRTLLSVFHHPQGDRKKQEAHGAAPVSWRLQHESPAGEGENRPDGKRERCQRNQQPAQAFHSRLLPELTVAGYGLPANRMALLSHDIRASGKTPGLQPWEHEALCRSGERRATRGSPAVGVGIGIAIGIADRNPDQDTDRRIEAIDAGRHRCRLRSRCRFRPWVHLPMVRSYLAGRSRALDAWSIVLLLCYKRPSGGAPLI
jgi:hypothetical protein